MFEDIELSRKKIVVGCWKRQFSYEMEELMKEKISYGLDSSLPEKEKVVKEALKILLKKCDLSLFKEVRFILNIIRKDFYENKDELRGPWHKELHNTLDGLVQAHLKKILLLCNQKGFRESNSVIVDEEYDDKASIEYHKFLKNWEEFNAGVFMKIGTKKESYHGLLKLLEMAEIFYKFHLFDKKGNVLTVLDENISVLTEN